MVNNKQLNVQSNYLSFLTLTYTMIIVYANWFDARLIKVFGIVNDAGTLVFPLSFLLSDIITEVYGYKHARRAIWTGFLFNIIFILYGQIVTNLPSPDFPNQNDMIDVVLQTNARIILASIISYLVAEPLNSFIVASMKLKFDGKFMGLRFITSTIIASGVDSTLFATLAFLGVIPDKNLILLILTMWFIKIIIEIIVLPFSILLAKKLKRVERLDIYDKETKFSVFSLDTVYDEADNGYKARK